MKEINPEGYRRRLDAMKQRTILRCRQRKAALIALFGGACQDCGITGHPAIFDFDHVDPSSKTKGVAQLMHGTWEELVKEAKKCRLLCANCHRIRTAKY